MLFIVLYSSPLRNEIKKRHILFKTNIIDNTPVLFSSLRIDQVNKYLDQVAQSNVEHKREDVKKVLQLLLRNTSALEQVLI